MSPANGTGKTGQPHVKKKRRKEIRSFFNSIHKTCSKWIKDLNMRLDTIKLLEKNTGRILSDINGSNIFFDASPRIIEIITKNKQMGPT